MRKWMRLVWGLAIGAACVAPAWAGDAAPQNFERRETLDDPPAPVAARPVTAPPAIAGGFGGFIAQVNVTAAGENVLGDAANESSICVDPHNPTRIAIGWRQFDTVVSNFRQAGFAYSRDGGRTWRNRGPLTPGVFRSDPVLDSDPDGRFYYYSLIDDFTCDLFYSDTGGATWAMQPAAFGGDKAWMVVDRTNSTGRGHVYVSWSENAACCGPDIFTRSTNRGASFNAPLPIANSPRWGTLAVGPGGELYVSGRGDSFSNFYVAASVNARNAGVTPTFSVAGPIAMGGGFASGGFPNPGGLLGQINIATDNSIGPRRGWVYMLATIDPSGIDQCDIMFTRSNDGGATWIPPLRVDDDTTTGNFAWFGTMSVAPNGRIDIVWNDTRNDPTDLLSETMYRFSSDGGATWSPRQVLTPPWNSRIGWPNQNKIGDYYHMVSDNVGANLAFAATFNGEQDVYYMRIGGWDCNGNGRDDAQDIAIGVSRDRNGDGIPDECEGLGDLNCDGLVDNGDIEPFVVALLSLAQYELDFPNCDWARADVNGDGLVDNGDIDAFVACLLAGNCP